MTTEPNTVEVTKVIDIIINLQKLIEAANESGQTHVLLSPLQAAFAVLDAAEDELDRAIDEAN